MWSAPRANESEFKLELRGSLFRVDPAVGGRITGFSCAGREVLCGLEDLGDWTNGGSTFWTSPQAAWGWPPDETLDRGRYAAELDTHGQTLALRSPAFRVAGSELQVTKRFSPDPTREGVVIEYAIENHGPTLSVAGWEISRVAATGVTFFAGAAICALGGLPLPEITSSEGMIWMPHERQIREAKLGAAAREGFIAYASDSLLFVKTFERVAPNAVASNEAEIELYVKPDSYVEIEQQGAVCTLEPGERLCYRLHWYLSALEQAHADATQLVAAARRLAIGPES